MEGCLWLLYGVHLQINTTSEQRRAVDYSFLQRDETLDIDGSKSTIEAGILFQILVRVRYSYYLVPLFIVDYI